MSSSGITSIISQNSDIRIRTESHSCAVSPEIQHVWCSNGRSSFLQACWVGINAWKIQCHDVICVNLIQFFFHLVRHRSFKSAVSCVHFRSLRRKPAECGPCTGPTVLCFPKNISTYFLNCRVIHTATWMQKPCIDFRPKEGEIVDVLSGGRSVLCLCSDRSPIIL